MASFLEDCQKRDERCARALDCDSLRDFLEFARQRFATPGLDGQWPHILANVSTERRRRMMVVMMKRSDLVCLTLSLSLSLSLSLCLSLVSVFASFHFFFFFFFSFSSFFFIFSFGSR